MKRETEQRQGAGPGLTAMVVYLRPSARSEVVTSLIDLGMFVREFDISTHNRLPWTPPAKDIEFAVVFAAGDAPEVGFIHSLTGAGIPCLVIVPAAELAERFGEGQFGGTVVAESSGAAVVRKALVEAARSARNERPDRSAVPEMTIFRRLHFRLGEPWLSHGEHLAGLSPVEHGLLSTLVSAQGGVVSKEILQRQLSRSEHLASDGYLKTVVLRIRRKAERIGGDSAQLAAVRGSGYMLRV